MTGFAAPRRRPPSRHDPQSELGLEDERRRADRRVLRAAPPAQRMQLQARLARSAPPCSARRASSTSTSTGSGSGSRDSRDSRDSSIPSLPRASKSDPGTQHAQQVGVSLVSLEDSLGLEDADALSPRSTFRKEQGEGRNKPLFSSMV